MTGTMSNIASNAISSVSSTSPATPFSRSPPDTCAAFSSTPSPTQWLDDAPRYMPGVVTVVDLERLSSTSLLDVRSSLHDPLPSCTYVSGPGSSGSAPTSGQAPVMGTAGQGPVMGSGQGGCCTSNAPSGCTQGEQDSQAYPGNDQTQTGPMQAPHSNASSLPLQNTTSGAAPGNAQTIGVTAQSIAAPLQSLSSTRAGTRLSAGDVSMCSTSVLAHFLATAGEAVHRLEWDVSGCVLVVASLRGHQFHVFRMLLHPLHPRLTSVSHLYVLNRGGTDCIVRTFSLPSSLHLQNIPWFPRWSGE